jgi:hypothetical protein
MHTKFWSENLRGRDHLEDLGIDERTILEWILGTQCGEVVEWIIFWLRNMVMKLWIL